MYNKTIIKKINSRSLLIFKTMLVTELFLVILHIILFHTMSSNFAGIFIPNVVYNATRLFKILVIVTGFYIPCSMCFKKKRAFLINTAGLKKYRQMLICMVYTIFIVLWFYLTLISIISYVGKQPHIIIYDPKSVVIVLWETINNLLMEISFVNLLFWPFIILKETLVNSELKYKRANDKVKSILNITFDLISIFTIVLIFFVSLEIVNNVSYSIGDIGKISNNYSILYNLFNSLLWIILNYLITSYYIYNNKYNVGI